MNKPPKLSPSLENYLEAIYRLEKRNQLARVKEIAELLNVSMPSVTGAVRNLRERGLVHYEKHSYINLTKEGLEIARSVQSRHAVLQDFLEKILLLEPELADKEACEIEHAIGSETARRFRNCAQALKTEIFDTGIIDADRWESIVKDKT